MRSGCGHCFVSFAVHPGIFSVAKIRTRHIVVAVGSAVVFFQCCHDVTPTGRSTHLAKKGMSLNIDSSILIFIMRSSSGNFYHEILHFKKTRIEDLKIQYCIVFVFVRICAFVCAHREV